MVFNLSRAEGNVRVAITAGTEHPKPIKRGTIERPESPSLRSSLSDTNATRAIYPLSSIMLRKKNRMMMMGTKLNTLPTPPKMASTTSDTTAGLTSAARIPFSQRLPRAVMPVSSQSCNGAPSTSMLSQMTRHMMTTNTGSAVHRPVSTLSMRRLRRYSLLTRGFTTVCAQSFLMKE